MARTAGIKVRGAIQNLFDIAYNSSLLLHATLANSTYAPAQGGLSRMDYEKIGMASFIQLAELRHRGAFSTVSQTFSTCCQRCGESSDPSISSLPAGWYMVRTNDPAKKISTNDN